MNDGSAEVLVRTARSPGRGGTASYDDAVFDVLGDVLEASRTDGVVFARVRFRAPWGLRCDPAPLAGFHIVARGTCSIHLDGTDTPLHLASGDIALVTQGEGHDLFDAPESPATPLPDLIGDLELGTIGHLELGDPDGPETVLVCGGYVFAQPGPHPLLSGLPPVVHLRHDDIPQSARATLDQLLDEIAHERDGSQTVINRLVDVLLIHMLRTWIDAQPPDQQGWFAALRDPSISAALRRIHRDYADDLSLADLASAATMSLSTFKRRFRTLVGESPGAYLTRHRLDSAARLLRDTDQPVIQIASAVGYRS